VAASVHTLVTQTRELVSCPQHVAAHMETARREGFTT